MSLRATLTTFGILALLAVPARAAMRRVPADHPTITAALAAAAPGDSVLVAAGTYSPSANGETFPLQMTTNGIRLIGAGRDATVLDAQGSAGVIRHDAAVGGRISGFRITGGRAAHGGGIRIDHGDVEVDHNLIDHNGASVGGGGLSMHNAVAPWIHHNLILNSFATSAADVHGLRYNLSSAGVFEHNVLAYSDGNGLLTVDDAAPSIRHNIFYRNGIPSPLRGRGICWLSNAGALVFHNEFFENQVAALLWQGGGGDFSGAMANAFDAMDQVYGNLDSDPQFVDPGAGDYHLRSTSPAIDAGDPALPHDPDGSIADIGPFPYTHVASAPPPVGRVVALSAAPNPLSTSTDIRFTLEGSGRVRVDVVDLSGRLVRVLSDGVRGEGTQVVRWDGSNDSGRLSPGVYYIRLSAAGALRVLPVVVIE